MKKYYIFGLIFTAVLFVSIISPRLFTQSYRLTKVGYIDLQRVIKEVTSDQELADKLKEKQEEYKQQNSTEDNSENSIANTKDTSLKGMVKRQVANSLMNIVKKEGYTLILERTENSILYADRTFDITESVIADVKASLKK
ncbi:OmpH family outer membrane protein [Brachyspira aalborgi]|uniref:OmpH family outer membrane protein n=1 Tax=Brachyspira aalborgi TaxID=29522 RepID=A0A5C8G0I4_9SPIR|nr:OmpH family outer membrane protein [Brachyspira aalborgi]MBS4762847.1 OmpH family outer membrane protein [Brachyspira sp.]TXJ15711.1 OmpH family outer membrane protein [Brachyspira aalborgi]TXJ18985.1 OmpH family outer membrane protein [Brachyspira aalborgi]TXJ32347.1 OmpH family outer membrane protein [Brachyspira aalborgi]TXJ40258.1 OmpH family outer membrane protein [Brachyspira aalborgi]